MKKQTNIPHEPEIESSVLGAILLEPASMLNIVQLLKPEHFYETKHRAIYTAMQSLLKEGIEIDTITVYRKCVDMSASFISSLTANAVSSANIVRHAQILVETWLQRESIRIADKLKESILENKADVFETLSKVIQTIEEKLNVKGASKSDLTLWQRLPEFFKMLDDERNQDADVTLKSEDFPTFNQATGGLRDGDYLLITGKWKRGKSRFANALAADFAVNKKASVGLISFEMSDTEFIKMILSVRLGVRYEYLRDPHYKNKDGSLRFDDKKIHQMKSRAEDQLFDTRIFISDEITTDYELFNLIRNWKHKHKVNVIVVDYLQLVQSIKKFEAKRLQIDDLSAGLKNLARSLKLKIIVIVQENEQGKTNEARGPIRDCDFWFSSSYPYADGENQIKINGQMFDVNESHFVIDYKESRHSKAGGKWVNIFHEDGTYKELAYEYEMINSVQEVI